MSVDKELLTTVAWLAEISGTILELTRELKQLTEAVIEIERRLSSLERQS